MIANPLTVVGIIISGFGWGWLLVGSGIETGIGRVFNLHQGGIISNVILLGYAVAVIGILNEIGKAITTRNALATTEPPVSLGSGYASEVPAGDAAPWLKI